LRRVAKAVGVVVRRWLREEAVIATGLFLQLGGACQADQPHPIARDREHE
jgi:hypothetical protein